MDQIYDVRRNHLQILADILSFCKTPQPKTRILYRTNTNSKLLDNYLMQLRISSLLETAPNVKKYSTTEKGTEFLETWTKLQEMMEPQKAFAIIKTKTYSRRRKQQLTAIPIINKRWAEN
jgi:predicted transcriptional regulator